MAQINVRLDDALLAAVDRERGDVPRNTWVVRLLERSLPGQDKPAQISAFARGGAKPYTPPRPKRGKQ